MATQTAGIRKGTGFPYRWIYLTEAFTEVLANCWKPSRSRMQLSQINRGCNSKAGFTVCRLITAPFSCYKRKKWNIQRFVRSNQASKFNQ